MPITRRKFIQSAFISGAGLFIVPNRSFSIPEKSFYFGIHSFILENPNAVFIMLTNIDAKNNSSAIKNAGLDFGRSVFGLTDDAESGIPLTHKVVIKPNLTCRARSHSMYTIERSMGIVTDAYFVEGIIESMLELGIGAGNFYIREVNCPDDLEDGAYLDMAERTGVDLQGINTPVSELDPDKVQWKDIPDGVCFRRVPYLWPVNSPDTFLLNIAKLKAHGMGLTLCAKNLQGTIAMNYQAHCKRYGYPMTGVDPADLSSTADDIILANYNRHKNEGIPRWDRPGETGGIWQETWATRCLDNNSVTLAGLHIIEGIYGRDGNFMDGPDPDGLATDYMTNYIIFGRNQFYVDIIGHYLGGHEPGNFGLFHMAMERGMISTINPRNIQIYNWRPEIGAMPINITDYPRYPLKTYYLQRDYDGQTEAYWHMVDEPYMYSATGIGDLPVSDNNVFMQQNYPNPFHNITSISFHIPQNGHVSIEIINDRGQLLERLVDKQLNSGQHTIRWDGRNYPSGLYFYHMRYKTFATTKKLIISH